MSVRPDLVACWVFRLGAARQPEILVVRRAPSRLYAGLWQCVTGKLEPDERIADGAMRELVEETGLGPSDLEAFFETDIVNWFHFGPLDAIVCEAVFLAHVRPDAAVVLSDEHDDCRWVSPDDAKTLVTWPAYERAIDFVAWLLANPAKARRFRIG